MKDRYFAIVGGTFVVPLVELSRTEMASILESKRNWITAVPVYFCHGAGVWPCPNNDCIVVKEVDLKDI